MYSTSRILPAGRRAVRRRMPKSISVYTVLHSSDGLRDERKRNALTLSSIQLAPMYKWWPSRRLWPWLAANNCQLQGQLLQYSWSSKQTGRSFPLPHPPPGILDPLPSLSLQKISDSLNHFHAIWARNALPYRQIPVQANLWFMQCLQIKFQPKTCPLRSANAASKYRITT